MKSKYNMDNPIFNYFEKNKDTFNDLHESNPFIRIAYDSSLVVVNNKKKYSTVRAADEDTGELSNYIQQKQGEKISEFSDIRGFVKIYDEGLGFIKGMTKAELNLFIFIQYEIEIGKDELFIRPTEVSEEIEISRTSIYEAIAGLVDRCIISRSKYQNVYYINPFVFFKGKFEIYFIDWLKRNNLYNEYIKRFNNNVL